MKNLLLVIVGALLWVLPLQAFVQLGNGDVYLDGRRSLVYDSNLFLRENNTLDDFLVNVYTGVGFIQQERSVLNLEVELGMDFERFFDYSSEDSDDFKSSFLLSYPNNVERHGYFSLGGGYNEDTQSNADVGQRIKTDTTDIDVHFHQAISDKTGLEFAAAFAQQDFSNGFDPINTNFALDRSSDNFNLSVLGFYQYSEKLSTTLSYAYQDVSYDDNITEQQVDTVAIGVRGEISPKVTGAISIGFRDTDLSSTAILDTGGTDPFYSLDLAWAPRDKTSIGLSGRASSQVSVYGDVNNRNDFQLSLTESISDKASLNAGFLYSDNDYQGLFDRNDESIMVFAGYFFSLDDQTSLYARANYEDRSSTLDGFGFDRILLTVGINSLF